MKGKLLTSLPPLHRHELPRATDVTLENSVAACDCGRLFVARWTDDSWGSPCWVPLRWWHFRARRLLRCPPPGADERRGTA